MMADTSLNDLTVLIIEDNAKVLGPLTHMVRDFGVRSVVTASDGEGGLGVLRENPVDMIISDFGADPVNGLDFARCLRNGENEAHRAIPIIMLATPEERTAVEQADDIGVDAFLGKPVSPSSLYSHMLAVAAKPRAFVETESYSGPDRRSEQRPAGDEAGHEAEPADHEAPAGDPASATDEAASAEALFVKSAHHDVEAIIRAYYEAVADPGATRQSLRLIGCLADIIADQGTRSGYPLMSTIAKSLCDYCREIAEPGGGEFDIVKAHADAMSAVIIDEIAGDGGAVGRALLSLLDVSVRRPIGRRRVSSLRRPDETPRAPGRGRHVAESAETMPFSPI